MAFLGSWGFFGFGFGLLLLGFFVFRKSILSEGVCDFQVGLGLKEAWQFWICTVAEQKFGE